MDEELLKKLRAMLGNAPSDATMVQPQPLRDQRNIDAQLKQMASQTMGVGRQQSTSTMPIPEQSTGSKIAEFGASVLPPIDIPQAVESVKDFSKGNIGAGTGKAAMAFAGALPLGKLKKAGKLAEELSTASNVEKLLIPAWHASKSDIPFSAFSREFYGSGAKGDRLGRATYATDQLPEAMEYLKTVTGDTPSYIAAGEKRLEVPLHVATNINTSSFDKVLQDAQNLLADRYKNMERVTEGRTFPAKVVAKRTKEYEDALNLLRGLSSFAPLKESLVVEHPGTLYKLGIDADREALLNYEKDLIDQTPFVQDALHRALGIKPSARDPKQLMAFNAMLNRGIRTPEVSGKLEEAGIQGVVANSATGHPNTKNYAMFDPNRVKILQALGILGMAGASNAALSG